MAGSKKRRRDKRRYQYSQIGQKLLHLAEEDCVPSKIKFIIDEDGEEKILEISSSISRYFLAPTKFRILINPLINGKEYPYAIFNPKCNWCGVEETRNNPNSVLKRVYEEVNKDIRGYYANQVKIIKPGTYLLHNIMDGERHSEKGYVKIYISVQGRLRETCKGFILRHEGNLKDNTFEIIIGEDSEKVFRVPIKAVELLIFEKEPVFEDTPLGKMGRLAVEMLKRGHICRPEPSSGFILDCCTVPQDGYSKPRLLFIRLSGNQFEIPKELIPDDEHDKSLKELIEKYGR